MNMWQSQVENEYCVGEVAVKFTVYVVQSFIKGHRKSGVISIKHSRDN